MSNPSPTDPVAVQEWAKSIGLVHSDFHKCYWKDKQMLDPELVAYFYNVVQQQMVAARLDEVKGLPDMQIEEEFVTARNHKTYRSITRQFNNLLRKQLTTALDGLKEKH